MFKSTLLAAASLLIPASALAETAPISSGDLMRHIEVLASDAFEGRRPGTAGGERTEAYLVSAFARAGLEPGAAGGLWRQTVRILERKPESLAASWQARGKAVSPAEIKALAADPHVRIANAPVLFAGHGTSRELAGRDIKGTILLVLSGPVPGNRERWDAEQLQASGVSAVIHVLPADAEWGGASAYWLAREKHTSRQGQLVEAIMSDSSAAALLRTAGADLAALRNSAAGTSFRATPVKARGSLNVQTAIRHFDTANIIGKVSGASHADEAIVLLAHWDHLGICRPEDVADRICNGAVDNASGTAILVETAERIASGARPARSVYFVATTAEEMGLIGAEAFAAAPPVTKEKIAAALNLDTTAIAPAGLPVAIIGRGEYPAIEKVVDATSVRLGRAVDTDTEANVMITRQDGWALARRGIPTIMATGSVSDMGLLQAYLGGVYHKPDDDIPNATELEGAVEDANLHVALVRALADPEQLSLP